MTAIPTCLRSFPAWRPTKSRRCARAATVNAIVDDETAALKGSISAEHGIGISNRDRLARVADPLELAWMARVKALFDPQNMMNPGKVLVPLPASTKAA